MKKILSMMLIMVFVLSSTITGFANSTESNFVVDNSHKRVMVEETIKGTVTHIFNKKTRTLTTETRDRSGKVIDKEVINLQKFENDIKSAVAKSTLESPKVEKNLLRWGGHYQNTFLNYEYERQGNYWDYKYELRKKSSYKTLSVEDRKNDIDQYVSAVDRLNAAEWAVISISSVTVFWAVVTYLDGGLTAGQAATAAGVAAGEVITLNWAVDQCEAKWRLYIQ